MSTPVRNATTAARQARKGLAGVVVSLRRGDLVTTGVVATVGETRVEDLQQDGLLVSVRYRDFLIDACDYGFEGEVAAPKVDDVITQELGGRTVGFQVLPLPGEREYRRSDRFGDVWRIHTREAFGNEIDV